MYNISNYIKYTRFSFIGSIIFHISVIALLVMGIPSMRFKNPPPAPLAIPMDVDLITVKDYDNLPSVAALKKQERVVKISDTEIKQRTDEIKSGQASKSDEQDYAKNELEQAISKIDSAVIEDLAELGRQVKDQSALDNKQQANLAQEKGSAASAEKQDINIAKIHDADAVKEKPSAPQTSPPVDSKLAPPQAAAGNKSTPSSNSPKNTAEKKKKSTKADREDDFADKILQTLEESTKKREGATKGQGKKINKQQVIANDDILDLIDDKKQKKVPNSNFNANKALSISELSAIRSQLSRAWNTSAFNGGNENPNMELTVVIALDMNGVITRISPQISTNSSGSATYKAFVDSAIRAIKSASPLRGLSSEKYDLWKEIEVRFDASGMIY